MTPATTIRPARPADAEALAACWAAFLKEQATYDDRFAPAEDALARWRNDFPVWLQDASHGLWVAEAGGTLAGFASAHRWAPPPIYRFSEEVHLDEVYVASAYRGAGLGRRLVATVQDWAAACGATRLRLTALAEAPAHAFWEALGARAFSRTYTLALGAPTRNNEETPKARSLGFSWEPGGKRSV